MSDSHHSVTTNYSRRGKRKYILGRGPGIDSKEVLVLLALDIGQIGGSQQNFHLNAIDKYSFLHVKRFKKA